MTGQKKSTWVGKSALFFAAVLAAACSPSKGAANVPQGKILLIVSPAEAHVYVDEKLQGTAAMFGDKPLLLPVGKHRLKLKAEDYFPEYIEISVTGKTNTVKVDMRKIPPPLVP